MKPLIVLSFLILAGCAQQTFTRDNTSNAAFERDKAQCEYEAKSAAAAYMGIKAFKEQELTTACLKAKGYKLI